MPTNDEELTGLLTFRKDTEYLVTGFMNPADVNGLCQRLREDKLVKRNCTSLSTPSHPNKQRLVGYMHPNRILVLEISPNGGFRLGIKIAGDTLDYLPFPRLNFRDTERFELPYAIVPFLMFGYVGRELAVHLLSAAVRHLKKPQDFRIVKIEFPTLEFSDGLKAEAKDIEAQIKEKIRKTARATQ